MALPAIVRDALPAIIAHHRAQLAPGRDKDLTVALTQTCALVGFSGSEASRTEWIAAAAARLQELPGDLVFEALRDAEKTCRHTAAIIPAVFAYAEDYPARRRARLAKLLVLAEAIGD